MVLAGVDPAHRLPALAHRPHAAGLRHPHRDPAGRPPGGAHRPAGPRRDAGAAGPGRARGRRRGRRAHGAGRRRPRRRHRGGPGPADPHRRAGAGRGRARHLGRRPRRVPARGLPHLRRGRRERLPRRVRAPLDDQRHRRRRDSRGAARRGPRAAPGPRRRRRRPGRRRVRPARLHLLHRADRGRARRRPRRPGRAVAGEPLGHRPGRRRPPQAAGEPGGPGRPGGGGAPGPGPAGPRPARPGGRDHGRRQVRVPPVLGPGHGPGAVARPRHLPLRRLQGRVGLRPVHGSAAFGGDRHRPVPGHGAPGADLAAGRAAPPRAPAQRQGRQGPGHPGEEGRPAVPAEPGHRRRRVRRPGQRGPRVRRRRRRRRPARALPGPAPHPGHPAPGGRHQGQPARQHESARGPAHGRRDRLPGRPGREDRRPLPAGDPRPRRRQDRSRAHHPVPVRLPRGAHLGADLRRAGGGGGDDLRGAPPLAGPAPRGRHGQCQAGHRPRRRHHGPGGRARRHPGAAQAVAARARGLLRPQPPHSEARHRHRPGDRRRPGQPGPAPRVLPPRRQGQYRLLRRLRLGQVHRPALAGRRRRDHARVRPGGRLRH